MAIIMTPIQCKMARAALGWTVVRLADESGSNKNTVVNFERGNTTLTSTVIKLKNALESTGEIVFTNTGVSICELTSHKKSA